MRHILVTNDAVNTRDWARLTDERATEVNMDRREFSETVAVPKFESRRCQTEPTNGCCLFNACHISCATPSSSRLSTSRIPRTFSLFLAEISSVLRSYSAWHVVPSSSQRQRSLFALVLLGGYPLASRSPRKSVDRRTHGAQALENTDSPDRY